MQPALGATRLKTVCSAKPFYILHRVPHRTWTGTVTIREWQTPQEVGETQLSEVRGEKQTTKHLCHPIPSSRGILSFRILCFL